jgi:hypothetical protein
LKKNSKYILFSFGFLCFVYGAYLFFSNKSLPEYQTKYNAGTEIIDGTEYAVHYAYYKNHVYRSVYNVEDPLGNQIGKADHEFVYEVKGHKDYIAIQGIFMSIPSYFKKIK